MMESMIDTDEIFEDRRRREQEKRGAVIGEAIGKVWTP